MGTFVLLLALLASNGWWLFVTVDQGVSLSYARQPNGTYARQPNGDLRVQACDGQLLATALGQGLPADTALRRAQRVLEAAFWQGACNDELRTAWAVPVAQAVRSRS